MRRQAGWSAARPLDRATVESYAERLASYEPRSTRRRTQQRSQMPPDRQNRSAVRSYERELDTERAYEPRPQRRAPRRAAPRFEERFERPRRATAAPAPPSRAPRRKPVRARRRPSRRRLLIRRAVLLVLVALVGSGLISYTSGVLLQASNVSLGVRSVEWLRGHGFAWAVNDIENLYYSWNAPKKGGPGLKALPHVGLAGAGHATTYEPPPIQPVLSPALPGEGVWHRTGQLVRGAPPVLVSTFRSDPNYPRLLAGVAWIDHTRTSVSLFPGRYEPPSAAERGPMSVPPAGRSNLVATFNSAFKLEDSGGGFVANGHTDAPLKDGLATLVGNSDGSVDVRAWQGGPQGGPNVVFARQNLPLIVEDGRLNPNLSDGPEWGATLGNAVRVWRSGVGIDGHGNLIYAGADAQTVSSLAEILRHAGAVRAMELDINYEWVSFNTFRWSNAGDPSKLLPGMDRAPTRYLTPDDRDFFAVFGK